MVIAGDLVALMVIWLVQAKDVLHVGLRFSFGLFSSMRSNCLCFSGIRWIAAYSALPRNFYFLNLSIIHSRISRTPTLFSIASICLFDWS
jgi:hypothetical protein